MATGTCTGRNSFTRTALSGVWGVLLLVILGVLLSMTGCSAIGLDSNGSGMSEPITESDEPEARKRARLRLELAAGYFENGQTTVALDEIKQSLSADPNYVPAHILRGLTYMRMDNSRLAEESFQRALQINPREPDALHNYAWFLCQQGRVSQSVDLFNRALSVPTYGGKAKTWMAKGICQLRMGQNSEAEASFNRSYELDAANPITAYNLATLQFRRGDDIRARFTIRRLNNSDLANAETLWLGIRVERRLRNTQAVEQLAQQLARRYPQSPEWALYQRGAFDE